MYISLCRVYITRLLGTEVQSASLTRRGMSPFGMPGFVPATLSNTGTPFSMLGFAPKFPWGVIGTSGRSLEHVCRLPVLLISGKLR